VIAQTLTSVSQGQGIRATALSQGVNKDTMLAWWMRLGERAPVLWDEIAQGKVRVEAVQPDELHTLIKKRGNHLTELEAQVGKVGVHWVWTAMDPVHKLLLVARVGPRTRDTLAPPGTARQGTVPVGGAVARPAAGTPSAVREVHFRLTRLLSLRAVVTLAPARKRRCQHHNN
jgi:hypothetical protein